MSKTRVLIEEEQEILREAYKAILSQESSIELVGMGDGACIANGNKHDIERILIETNPHVVLLGTKIVRSSTITGLEILRVDYPHIGVVLLSAHYDAESIGRLKGFARKSKRGAYLLKGSVSTRAELVRIIRDVTENRVTVDPQVFAGLIQDSDFDSTSIDGLTKRELELLRWIAMGYRNAAIAQILCLEPKTVERHISSILSKLNNGDSKLKHPRVDATLCYLQSIGQLRPDITDDNPVQPSAIWSGTNTSSRPTVSEPIMAGVYR